MDADHLIFLGSPLLRTLTEANQKGVYVCDIATYDTTREFLLLNQLRQAEVGIRSALSPTALEVDIAGDAIINHTGQSKSMGCHCRRARQSHIKGTQF